MTKTKIKTNPMADKFIVVKIEPPARYRIVPDDQYDPKQIHTTIAESLAHQLIRDIPSLYELESKENVCR